MHRLLKRQLQRAYGKDVDVDTLSEATRNLLQQVAESYITQEEERRHFEHTIDIHSRELNDLNRDLRKVLRLHSEAQRLSRTGHWILDVASDQYEWSDELFRILELDPFIDKPDPKVFIRQIHPEDLELADTKFEQTKNLKQFNTHYRLVTLHGETVYIHELREVVSNAQGEAVSIQGVIQDVTEQKKAEAELHLYASVFRNSGESILISDDEGRIMAVNNSFTRSTGYSFSEVDRQSSDVLFDIEASEDHLNDMDLRLKQVGFWQGELIIRHKDGYTYPVWLSISSVYDSNHNVINYITNFSDISERKEQEERIHYLAHHDALTGLINRFSFEERLSQAVHSARRENLRMAVLFIDMDRFKMVNDTLGHQAGDKLLKEVARRLKSSVRESDIVARLGGDEFVVGLTGLKKDMDALPTVHLIQHMLAEPYHILGKNVHSTPSIGVSVYPTNGENCETLLVNADSAMYHAKQAGRNNHQFFTESMNADANKRLELENYLRQAVREKDFYLMYQPQIDTVSMQVCGVEALIRWDHPKLGKIGPDQFIPIAEETRLIIPMGSWVIQEACRQMSVWKQQGLVSRVAVNIAAQQLRSPNLVQIVKQSMMEFGIEPGELELEVTESSMMDNPDEAIERLRELKALGVVLAIDDFGTGYSSLAYLKKLPVDTLKIDREFVSHLQENNSDAKICSATLALAHNLGLSVVAEGVETLEQQHFLVKNHCEVLQGFYYSRPLLPDDVLAYIQSKKQA